VEGQPGFRNVEGNGDQANECGPREPGGTGGGLSGLFENAPPLRVRPEHAYARRLRTLNRTPNATYATFQKGIENQQPEIASECDPRVDSRDVLSARPPDCDAGAGIPTGRWPARKDDACATAEKERKRREELTGASVPCVGAGHLACVLLQIINRQAQYRCRRSYPPRSR